MAATQTVPQHRQHCNFIPIVPRHGVVTLLGYGIRVHVDRGHLTIQDGIGGDRRAGRLSPRRPWPTALGRHRLGRNGLSGGASLAR